MIVKDEITILFNAITDALDELGKINYGTAKDILIVAQQEAEDIYIHNNEGSGQ